MNEPASLRPFFKYFGSKWRTIARYPAPRHHLLIEPFAGSASYATRFPWSQVRLYDTDPYICGVWDYLIKVSPAEVRALPLAFEHVREIDGPQEARWLVGYWLHAGQKPAERPTGWMINKKHKDTGLRWGARTRERIASQVDQIRHWRVFNKSYHACPDALATWFVDPPYQNPGTGSSYVCKFQDYPALAEWCRARRGQVIACEQAGADWLPFRPLGSFCSLNSRPGDNRTAEVVWTNSPG